MLCISTSVLVSPEDSHTSVLLSQGTFSWQGLDSPNEGATEDGAAKGSLLLHGLNLHVAKVQITRLRGAPFIIVLLVSLSMAGEGSNTVSVWVRALWLLWLGRLDVGKAPCWLLSLEISAGKL